MSRDQLNLSMDDLFPQPDSDTCRVCTRDVVDGRWSYCSTRCRDIAQAVQRMFLWDVVRKQVLERDEHTCQSCGITKERWWRAYQQTMELVYDRIGDGGSRLDESALIDAPSNGGYHVDHIQRIADDGHPLDESNLQTLCKFCHREKTRRENTAPENARPDDELNLEDYLDA